MVLIDIANVIAGAYKGYMNAAGQDVDPTYLAYVLGTTSLIDGVCGAYQTKVKGEIVDIKEGTGPVRKSPAKAGLVRGLIAVPAGALEMAVGYGLGWLTNKLIS